MREDAPIFVIGAGPAGAAAAWALARAGRRRIILLERAGWPRPKACAGGLGPRALPRLQRMGLLGEAEKRGRRCATLRFTTPRGRQSLVKPEAMAGIVLPRAELDQLLVERATDAGVELRPETRVRSITVRDHGVELATSRGDCEGVAAIVATGAVPSIEGVDYPERTRTPALMARFDGVPHAADRIEMAYPRALIPHYLWLFPEPQGTVNVGLIGRSGGPPLHRLFDEVLVPHFADRLVGATQLGRRVGAGICFASSVQRIAGPRLLLTGEAAGLVNGLTGEGIPHALESGEIAGQVLADAAAEDRFDATVEIRYRLLIERRFARTLRRARAGLRFFASPLFPLAAELMTVPAFGIASTRLLAAA